MSITGNRFWQAHVEKHISKVPVFDGMGRNATPDLYESDGLCICPDDPPSIPVFFGLARQCVLCYRKARHGV